MEELCRGRCAARNGIIWVKQMKQLITALCMAYAAAAFASARIEVPTLPLGEYADTEVSMKPGAGYIGTGPPVN